MAGQVLKRRRLVNPRRRRMTPAQIKFFGTKRQKAALRNARSRRKFSSVHSGWSRKIRRARKRGSPAQASHYAKRSYQRAYRAHNQGGDTVGRIEHAAERAIDRIEDVVEDALKGTGIANRGRRKNVGEILTVIPANPGRRRRRSKVAAATRRRNRRRASNRGRRRVNRRRMVNRRRSNFTRRHRRRTRAMNPRVVVRYRNRRRNRGHRRRRNPGFLTGNAGAVVGVLGGAAVTKILTGFLPSTLTTGWAGYLTTGVVAMVQGNVIGRMTRNRSLGNWMTIGGLLIVGLQIAGNLFPQLQLPFGLSTGTSGMGLLTSSNFYVPQANIPGSMATFVTPAGVTAAIPVAAPVTAASLHGLGQQFNPGLRTMRRVGRLR